MNTTTEKITVPHCHRCSTSVLEAGVLLIDVTGAELCLSCVEAGELHARTEAALETAQGGPDWLLAMKAEAKAKVVAEHAAAPQYKYQATVRGDGHAVERLVKHAAGPWHLSTGILVLEDESLEVCSFVAVYLNTHTTKTDDVEGLAPLEALEEIKVRRALETIVWELADGDVDETGVWVDAACWQVLGTTRAAELGQ